MRTPYLALVALLVACASRTRPPVGALPNVPTPAAHEPLAVVSASTAAAPEREPAELRACPQLFPSPLRGQWHEIDGEHYHVDAQGRPNKAEALFPPIAAEERANHCQREVGGWGDQADPGQDYDGGHMIGAQLGGWGARANMVPQEQNFNKGTWKVIEDRIANHCSELAPGRLKYTISVSYPNASTLIPSSMEQHLEDTATGASITLTYDNTVEGGAQGLRTRAEGVAWLRALGC